MKRVVLIALALIWSSCAFAQGINNPCTNPATSTVPGCVKPDGTTITNTAGAIAVNFAGTNTWTGTNTFNNGTYFALFTGGSVGIGTAGPTQKLDVRVGDTDGWVALISNDSNAATGLLLGKRGGIPAIGTVGAGNMVLGPDGGNVGIGTASPGGLLTVGSATGTAPINVAGLSNTATTSALCYNTTTGAFTYDGTIGTCSLSDERFKNMGERIPNALEKLLQINGVYFTWKDPTENTGRQIGVGAQTVEKVFPELVQTGVDGKKSVDYQHFVAPIIEAIRELKADNDNLRAEIKATVHAR